MNRSSLYKLIVILCLSLALVLTLCACGENDGKDDTSETKDTSVESNHTPGADDPAKATYKVTLQDESGAPVAGYYVQLCQGEICLNPIVTDANGVAQIEAAPASYTVKYTDPNTYRESEAYTFPEGSTELVITVASASTAPETVTY